MLYQIVLVEDDENIRKGLAQLIDWVSLGFSIKADFADGEETLAYLNQNKADVLLTDIRLKTLSGIDLAQSIRQTEKDMHIVFISGYRDFECARSAIQMNADAYLLKPLKLDELYKTFSEIRQQLDQQAAMKGSLSEEQMDYVLGRLLHELIVVGQYQNMKQLSTKQAALGLQFKLASAFLCLFGPSEPRFNTPEGAVIGDMTLERLLQLQGIHDCVIYETTAYDDTKLLVFHHNETEALRRYHAYCRKNLCQDLLDELGQEYRLFIGEIISSPLELSASYQALRTELSTAHTLPDTTPQEEAISLLWIDKAKKYIQDHYDQPLTLEEVSSHIFVSAPHFCRIFKATTGESFVQYVTRIRIDAAMHMMKTTNHSIWQIAQAVGYSSAKYFSRIFKTVTGESPSDYQKKVRDLDE